MSKKFSVTAVAGLVALALNLSVPAAVQADSDDKLPPSITVSGEGHAYAKPDIAYVNVGVTTEASSAIDAMKSNNTAAAALMRTIADKGIADRDVQTTSFNIYPQYKTDSFNHSQKVNGYRVQNQFRLKIRKVSELGPLLDAVVENGANTVNGISFDIDQREPIMQAARKEAIANARKRCEAYAEAAGVQIGQVLYITESGGIRPPTPRFRAMAAASFASDATVPVAAGEQDLVCNVTVVYAIGH